MVIASTGILLKDKKILLIKRSNYTKEFPGCWGFSGGRADSDETPEEAVTREIKEELNLSFKPTKLFAKGKHKDRDLYRYLGEWKGEIKIQEEEIVDWGWFSYDKAIKLKLAFDYKKILNNLHDEKLI
jgi:8-oxo-dGTP diphosphatase